MLCWFQENFEPKRNLILLYFGSKTSWSKHNCIKNILSSQVETCSKTSYPDVTYPYICSDLTFDPVQTLHTYTYSRYFRDTYETFSRQPQDTKKNLHIHTCEVISYARKRWATGGQVGWVGGFIRIMPLAPSCKLVLARFSTLLRIEEGAECVDILGPQKCLRDTMQEVINDLIHGSYYFSFVCWI